jgi:serine/threonine protein phosphatase PrpC
VVDKFVGSMQAVLFGVFDGHGSEGKVVSSLVARALPEIISRSLTVDHEHQRNYAECLSTAFRECNQVLGRIADLDLTMSGSTGVVAMVSTNHLVVSNLGDSRCILGKVDVDGQHAAFDLSNDHKPEQLAEANRILAAGVRPGSRV